MLSTVNDVIALDAFLNSSFSSFKTVIFSYEVDKSVSSWTVEVGEFVVCVEITVVDVSICGGNETAAGHLLSQDSGKHPSYVSLSVKLIISGKLLSPSSRHKNWKFF